MYRFSWLLLGILIFVSLYILIIGRAFSYTQTSFHYHEKQNVDIEAWDRCELPDYDIWDNEILKYLDLDRDPLKDCDKAFKPLTQLINSSWSIVTSNQTQTCRARCHSRKSEWSNIVGNWSHSPGPMNCEVVEAVCSDESNEDIYGYLHTQIIPTPTTKPKIETSSLKQHDVIVILLDSLAYSQAKRSLSRTLSYFTDHMDGVLFPYINKVGDNSGPNGVALWFGKSLQKVDRTLFETSDIPADWTSKYFCTVPKDNETSLFHEFQNYGYKTLLAEDWASGTLNYPSCAGFHQPPVDHYMRPFQNAYEKTNLGMNITRHHLKGHLCRETHHTILDYLSQFIKAYPDQKKFGWTWTVNLGHYTENGFGRADKDFQNFLIEHREQLEESFVFILGDHGLRYGGIRSTAVGALDVNNPFTAVSIPKSLRKTTNILEIMTENSKKIQTHYDTRATILDIMKYQSAANFTETDPYPITGEKGFSYIRRQPNVARNCRNIPIPLQYCICQFNKTFVPTNSTIASDIGKAVTNWINQEIENGTFAKECIQMDYDKTLGLEMYEDKFKGSTLYTIKIKMKDPSKAEFKANVKVSEGITHVLGMVERSNKYGRTADCISSEYHRPFCYCKNQTEEGHSRK